MSDRWVTNFYADSANLSNVNRLLDLLRVAVLNDLNPLDHIRLVEFRPAKDCKYRGYFVKISPQLHSAWFRWYTSSGFGKALMEVMEHVIGNCAKQP